MPRRPAFIAIIAASISCTPAKTPLDRREAEAISQSPAPASRPLSEEPVLDLCGRQMRYVPPSSVPGTFHGDEAGIYLEYHRLGWKRCILGISTEPILGISTAPRLRAPSRITYPRGFSLASVEGSGEGYRAAMKWVELLLECEQDDPSLALRFRKFQDRIRGQETGAVELRYNPPSSTPYDANPQAKECFLEMHMQGWQWYVLHLTQEDIEEGQVPCRDFIDFMSDAHRAGWLAGQDDAEKQVERLIPYLWNKSDALNQFRAIQDRIRAEASEEVLSRLGDNAGAPKHEQQPGG
jgi:hypothetical protein